MTLFYDSARPELIPAGATHAALYRDGDYGAAGITSAARFLHHRWITVLGDFGGAGIADYEPGNAIFEPGRLSQWAGARAAYGLGYRTYCDRDNAGRAWRELGGLAPGALWWISTLDGVVRTAAELSAELHELGAPVPAGRIWGQQFAGGENSAYDTSVLLGQW
jgi:hypothetical protein